jgi:hypothetical protein
MERSKKKAQQEAARKKLLQQFTAQQIEFAKTLDANYGDDEDDTEPNLDQGLIFLHFNSLLLFCSSFFTLFYSRTLFYSLLLFTLLYSLLLLLFSFTLFPLS